MDKFEVGDTVKLNPSYSENPSNKLSVFNSDNTAIITRIDLNTKGDQFAIFDKPIVNNIRKVKGKFLVKVNTSLKKFNKFYNEQV